MPGHCGRWGLPGGWQGPPGRQGRPWPPSCPTAHPSRAQGSRGHQGWPSTQHRPPPWGWAQAGTRWWPAGQGSGTGPVGITRVRHTWDALSGPWGQERCTQAEVPVAVPLQYGSGIHMGNQIQQSPSQNSLGVLSVESQLRCCNDVEMKCCQRRSVR